MKKNTQLIETLSGNATEPPLKSGIVTKTDLIKLLNWYSANATDDELKSYLLLHSKTIDLNKSSISVVRSYGAIARCVQRGFMLTDDVIQRLDHFVMSNQKTTQTSELKRDVIKGKSDSKIYLEDIDIGIDCALLCKTHQPNHATTTTNIKECVEYINKHLEQNESDYLNKGIERKSYLRIKEYLEGLIKFYSVKKTSVKKVTTKRRVSNTQIVKSVKYNSDKKPYIKKQLTPIDLIGKKKAWVFDCNKNTLICYIAVLDGFTFKGTTLQNYDEKKSTFKKIKDESVLTQSLSEINRCYNNIKTTEKLASPRFNENMLILACS